MGAGSLPGCDLTQGAVDRLVHRHPDVPFLRLDISQPETGLERDWFTAVSCVDV